MRPILCRILIVPILWTAFGAGTAMANPETSDREAPGPVGWWNFDKGTGEDLSGNGNDADLGEAALYSLGDMGACLQIVPDSKPLKIPVSENSPLAISRGTLCLWLNVAWEENATVLEYDNDAVQFRLYRRHIQPRFEGEDDFDFGSGILDYDWPKYDLREWAFYPHTKAAVGESEWRHFAVAYDDRNERIVGWRDGELISVVDLSAAGMEPLKREELEEIATGDNFAGFLDDIRIYDRVLDQEEVESIFRETAAIYQGRSDTIETKKKMKVYEYREEDDSLYRAWLQFKSSSDPPPANLFSRIVVESPNSTVATAGEELSEALSGLFDHQTIIETHPGSGSKVVLGTPETSSWIREKAVQLGLDRVKDDGFLIKSVEEDGETTLVVAGAIPAGVVFGTFDLIRRLQAGQEPEDLDVLENPKIPIRMVNHWSNFRGFLGDDSRGGTRDASIFSWEDLRAGDTKLIRDWVRLLSAAGWNALCPSEINWDYRNNYLDHLDEVETLAGICRDYGMKLYWSPSYLLALEQATADQLYSRVPDFGGYMLKLGSEGQGGDPRPPMVNRIADTLAPHGGMALVRGFVYGKSRYTPEPYRNLIPYDIFASEDGAFRDNVVIVPKGSPMDWDFSAPIPAMDGAIQKNLSGSELVIDKNWPVSWIEKWKWWLEQDNYRGGPGSLNKFDVDCIMGVSMIEPSPAWTGCPLNMVNYYGLGRLAWNPDLAVEQIYAEWIRQTFGNVPEVLDTIESILLMLDDITRKLYTYRGYRGVWIDTGDDGMAEDKTPYSIIPEGIGVASEELKERILDQYAPGLREVYGDPTRGEEFLSSFHFSEHDTPLSIGRTLIQDVYGNLEEAVEMSDQVVELWKRLEGKIEPRQFAYTLETLADYTEETRKDRTKMAKSFEEHTGKNREDAIAGLTADALASKGVFNVRHFGAVADGEANDATAIQEAIDTCEAAGGGKVFIPSGIYGSGSIQLKNNVTLVLDAGAVLKALPGVMNPWEPNPHDLGLMDPAYYHWQASLIWGENLENVKVLGPGTLDGRALTKSSKVPEGIGDKAVALKLCKNVEIRNLNIREGGHYAILATGCEDVIVDNVTIETSRDGLNFSQCRIVTVEHCHIDSVRYEDGQPAGGDDAIKLGSDLSLGETLPSSNITVRNCSLASGCNAMQFGTETVGAFENIRFENIRIHRAGKAGIGITSNDGSDIRNIHFKNIEMEKTFLPIFIKISDVARVPEGTYSRGSICDVTLENIVASDCYSYLRDAEMTSVIWGKPETPIENLLLKNVRITAKGGHPVSEASSDPPENDERMPRKVGDIPAYGCYLRHVKNIRFQDCRFGFERNDDRPALTIDRGEGVNLEGCELEKGDDCPDALVIRGDSKVKVAETGESP